MLEGGRETLVFNLLEAVGHVFRGRVHMLLAIDADDDACEVEFTTA